MSPTARTLKKLRDDGWTAQVVEKWIPQVKRRRDCFGFDVLACMPGCSSLSSVGMAINGAVLGVQATSGDNHASRKAKLLKNAEAANWVASGGRLEVWSWRKASPRGKRPQWTCRIEALTLSDYAQQGP